MHFLIPETIQTSAVDCGPAALKSLLDGFGLPASYGRLREACQTALDGTSIDTIEDVARELGLDAEQIMVPVDHLELDAQLLPAVVVVTLPNGFAHFVVVWRRTGAWFQVMDPAVGRVWITRREFLASVYRHRQNVDAAAWREWASSADATRVLQARIAALAGQRFAREAIDRAAADERWQSLARLDAAARMAASLVRAGAIRKGVEAERFIAGDAEIPDSYWSVAAGEEEGEIVLRGAVLLRVRGTPQREPARAATPEIAAAMEQGEVSPVRRLLSLLDPESRRLLPPLALSTAILGTTTMVHGLVFRALFDLVDSVGVWQSRLIALTVVLGLAATLLLLEYITGDRAAAIGRELEARFGVAFLSRVAALRNEYFSSRLISDMAERVHSIQELRYVPLTAYRFIRAGAAFIVTAAAIWFLQPVSALPLLLVGAAMLALVWIFRSFFYDTEMRVRTHAGGLARFYLEALAGLTTLRAHGAEGSVRREHESLLTEWMRAVRRQITASVSLDTALAFCGVAVTLFLLRTHLATTRDPAGILLIAYWGLNLPLAAADLSGAIQAWSVQRSIALRLIEPLDAPEEAARGDGEPAILPDSGRGVSIDFDGLGVTLAGHAVLTDISLSIAAGTHVAIVGRSGAGKSTLVATLLGLIAPSAGEARVDGQPLDAGTINALRPRTAWVDPAVQLWNAPLEANIVYAARDTTPLPQVIREAQLYEVLERLSDLQRPLGEGGGLLSGGEGQRVRAARALMQREARLVILDEAFRGIDRETRGELLRRCRELWRDATVLCVTHDVDEALLFDRVLVLDEGRLIEDDDPRALAARSGSAFADMRVAAARVREEVWGSAVWRRIAIVNGRVEESRRVASLDEVRS
ncbi:MAG TPA: ATP-binding cassette domain-containing protein [Thermoanaerobaculia bacterium]|nr:ATP-binding cassette domain-containing protein [Thermoanaerobaculia bacterium]